MAPQEPGLLTRIIPATVMPRKASSESMRAVAFDVDEGEPSSTFFSARPRVSSTRVDSYSPTVVPIVRSSFPLGSTFLVLVGARAEPELCGRGQRRAAVVLAQGLLDLLAAREPARGGEVVSREHARQPVRPILFQPKLPILFAQRGQLLRHLA